MHGVNLKLIHVSKCLYLWLRRGKAKDSGPDISKQCLSTICSYFVFVIANYCEGLLSIPKHYYRVKPLEWSFNRRQALVFLKQKYLNRTTQWSRIIL